MLRRPPKRKNAENDVSSQRVREGRERESSETTSDTIENYLTQIERGHCARDETIPSRSDSIYEAETKLFIEHCS